MHDNKNDECEDDDNENNAGDTENNSKSSNNATDKEKDGKEGGMLEYDFVSCFECHHNFINWFSGMWSSFASLQPIKHFQKNRSNLTNEGLDALRDDNLHSFQEAHRLHQHCPVNVLALNIRLIKVVVTKFSMTSQQVRMNFPKTSVGITLVVMLGTLLRPCCNQAIYV